MKKILLTAILVIGLVSCSSKPIPPKVCVVAELREVGRGENNPDLYVITKDREVLDFRFESEHFVRLKPGDSIKIYYTNMGFIERIDILN